MRFAFIGLVLAGLWSFIGSVPASADSWALPSKEVYESSNRQFRLTVFPRELSSQLDYLEDEVGGKGNPGQQPGSGQTRAEGLLERRQGKGWTLVWRKPLVNDVAPVEAVVADSGRYVATFDNWHFMGHGENVVVLYGPDGSLVRSLELSDFLPNFYIKALPHSVSSIWWRDEPSFAPDDRLIMKVAVPTEEQLGIGAREFLGLTLDPLSGAVVPMAAAEWEAALDNARRLTAARDAAEQWEPAASIEAIATAGSAQNLLGHDPETKDRLTPEAMEQLVEGPLAALRKYGLQIGKAEFERLREAEAANGASSVRMADLLTAFGVGLHMEWTISDDRALLRSSRDYLEAAIGPYRDVFGSRHPEVAVALHSFADVDITLNDGHLTPQAEAALQEALKIRLATLGPQHRETRATEDRLATPKATSVPQEKLDSAARALEEASRALEAARQLEKDQVQPVRE